MATPSEAHGLSNRMFVAIKPLGQYIFFICVVLCLVTYISFIRARRRTVLMAAQNLKEGKKEDIFFDVNFEALNVDEILSEEEFDSIKAALQGRTDLTEALASFAKKTVQHSLVAELQSVADNCDTSLALNRKLLDDLEQLKLQSGAMRLANSNLSQRLEGYLAMKEDHKELVSRNVQTEHNLDNVKANMKTLKQKYATILKENSDHVQKAKNMQEDIEALQDNLVIVKDRSSRLNAELLDLQRDKMLQKRCNELIQEQKAEEYQLEIEKLHSFYREKIKNIFAETSASAEKASQAAEYKISQMKTAHDQERLEKLHTVSRKAFDMTHLFPKEYDEDRLCTSCEEQDAQVMYMPCGHKEQCVECAWRWRSSQSAGNTCPKCRSNIISWR